MTESLSETRPSRALPAWRERARGALRKAHAFALKNYGIDTRALAVFRIGLGILLLSDLYSRALHLTAHYTDAGFMPRDRLVGGWSHHLFYSFHNYGGNETSQIIMFSIAAVFAFMLLVGYRTRMAAVMSWLLLTSLQGRNYLILQGGDDILRVLMFWALFTPMAARYSVDAVLASRKKHVRRIPERVLSIGALALVCQLFAMYVVSAILKAGPAWHGTGHAIHLALHHHAFATPFGIWLAQLPAEGLRAGAYAVWWLELVAPFAFFIPFKTHLWRTALALTYIAFHFGLFLSMELGHFPWVCMVAWLTVLPTWFWDRPFARFAQALGLQRAFEVASRSAQRLIKRLAPRLPSVPGALVFAPSRRWSTAVAAVLVAYAAHGTAYAAKHQGNVDGAVYEPLMMLRLNANWGMFAPNPPSDSGWFVFVAKQRNGLEIDPWRDGQAVDWEKPERPAATYKTQRWRKFLDNIINPRHAVVRPYFLRWLCNDWNQRHESMDQIRHVEFFHMVQTARWPDKGYHPIRKVSLGTQHCPATPPQH